MLFDIRVNPLIWIMFLIVNAITWAYLHFSIEF